MKLKKKIVIAIDGFSSCGKSSFAKLIAKELGYIFIDTGAMYRTISLFALRNGMVLEKSIDESLLISRLHEAEVKLKHNEKGQVCAFLNGENVENEIRGVQVSELVSEVSKIREVRRHLVKLQQDMGKNKGIVMDGRDIGTVVFPLAGVKIFMTASTEVRAHRRFKELQEKGLKVSFEEIKKNIEERDSNDLNRKESPLKQADDAVVLDNSNMNFEDQMKWFKNVLKSKKLLKD